jgi:hypothetical protein
MPFISADHIPALQVAIILSPLPLENVYTGYTDQELVIDTGPKENCAHE